MRHLDLFSGIGGFALAAKLVWGERHNLLAFCEKDKFCQKVLKKHWPNVPIVDDIVNLTVDSIVSAGYSQLSLKEREVIDMVAKRKDYDEAVYLYESGLSIQNVANFYDITRQAMWMILKKRGCVFRQQIKTGIDNHFFRGTKASDKAQNILEKAIEKKIIKRKLQCEKCNYIGVLEDGRTAIQAHHTDYNKPLQVMWLCQKCHHEWHKNNKAVERKEVVLNEELSRSTTIDIVSGGFP